MDAHQHPDQQGQRSVGQVYPGRLVGLHGRLARPFLGVMGIWSTFCGALATDHLQWDGEVLLMLTLVMLLVDLAWGSLWDLAVGTDWSHLLASSRSPVLPIPSFALPFTRSASVGGRLSQGLRRSVGWWRGALWPEAGSVVLGLVAAAILAGVLSLLLPGRVLVLNLLLVAPLFGGVLQRLRGNSSLAGQAFVLVALGWLAGSMAFAELNQPAVVLALSFALAAWGALRAGEALSGGLWLLNTGQLACVALLAIMRQPLAAGAVGLLLAGQVALEIVLYQHPPSEQGPSRPLEVNASGVMRRTWPWLMAAMLVAAVALA
jgi:hypothetical protein